MVTSDSCNSGHSESYENALTFSCKSLKFPRKWYTKLCIFVDPFLKNCVTKSNFRSFFSKKGQKKALALKGLIKRKTFLPGCTAKGYNTGVSVISDYQADSLIGAWKSFLDLFWNCEQCAWNLIILLNIMVIDSLACKNSILDILECDSLFPFEWNQINT